METKNSKNARISCQMYEALEAAEILLIHLAAGNIKPGHEGLAAKEILPIVRAALRAAE